MYILTGKQNIRRKGVCTVKKIYNVIVKLGDETKRNDFQKDLAIFSDIKLHFADDKAGIRNLKKKIAADFAVLNCDNSFGFAQDSVINGSDLTAHELSKQLLGKCGLKEVEYNPETVDEFFHKVEMCIEAGREYTNDEIKQIIKDVLNENGGMSKYTHNQIAGAVFNIIRGWDVLTGPLDNPNINEIMINGTDKIFVEANGEITQLGIQFYSQQRLRNVINRMISQVGRQIDESNPIVDARLPDGSRINAVLDPVAINGPILTIRKFSREMLTMDDLIKSLDDSYDILMISNPNNPTSKIVSFEDIKKLAEACRDHKIFLIVDEMYIEFVDDYKTYTAIPLTDEFSNLAVIRSVSKFFAVPGLRFGYAVMKNPALMKLVDITVTKNNIASLSAIAASAMFKDDDYIEQGQSVIHTERSLVYLAMSTSKNIKLYKPAANFMLVRLLGDNVDSTLVADHCNQRGIIIRRCDDIRGLDNKFIRFCFMNPKQNDLMVNTILEIV